MTTTASPATATLHELDHDECLRLISPGGIGRVAFNGAFGPAVLPVNYHLHDGAIVFRTRAGGAMDRDLRTGSDGLEIKIAFQVDQIDQTRHEGWSVLIQGPAHHVDHDEPAPTSGLQPWAGGEREHYIRIVPLRVTGRRVQAPQPTTAAPRWRTIRPRSVQITTTAGPWGW